MIKFALYSNPKAEIKVKDKADLLEAFLGALYVDKDLTYCQVFANVCFFPRLHEFILNQVMIVFSSEYLALTMFRIGMTPSPSCSNAA